MDKREQINYFEKHKIFLPCSKEKLSITWDWNFFLFSTSATGTIRKDGKEVGEIEVTLDMVGSFAPLKHLFNPDDKVVFIRFFSMENKQRGKGFGSQVLNFVADLVKQKAETVKYIGVESFPNRIRFYARNGFKIAAKAPSRDNLLMIRELGA